MIPKEEMEEQIRLMGEKTIALIAVEEMAELSKALLKNVNRGKDNLDDVFEELADVSVLLEFLKIIYDISDEKMWEYIDRKHVEKWRPRIEKLKREAANGRKD
jgi:NTP pyrophosphatase (non-canonical NTP hydrolase)